MIILRLLFLLTNLHLKLLSTQGTGADKLLSTQRVKLKLLKLIYKINCCTFMFNMSNSRIALKRNNTVITIKHNENYIAPIIKIQNL